MTSARPHTIEDWIRLARETSRSATIMLAALQPNRSWTMAGFAVECALKAAIMRHRRYKSWPSRESDPKLYSHDLRYLMAEAGIVQSHLLTQPIAAKWLTVLMWHRGDDYDPTPMPMVRASNMVTSMKEVLEWINTRFQMDI